MITANGSSDSPRDCAPGAQNGERAAHRRLHRLAIVRRQSGVSARCLASRMNTSIADVQQQEKEGCDLLLSDLYKWQSALDVPISELLVEPETKLSPNVRLRAALLRIMKTVKSMERQIHSGGLRRLIIGLEKQLTEVMPELAEVPGWPIVGKRRTPDEIAPIEERTVKLRFLENLPAETGERE
jgi:transcriptional regulator with XRE-family HTH domain